MAAKHEKTGLKPEFSGPKKLEEGISNTEEEASAVDQPLFTTEMRQQLESVFGRMEKRLLLKLYLDTRPISSELKTFMTALAGLSDKLALEIQDIQRSKPNAPYVEVCYEDGNATGLAFHGVPSGHEFTSFVLGLYNAAGPGQAIEEDTRKRIAAVTEPTDIKILVTLSCSMCPDLVIAAQRIAAENLRITAHVYDIQQFEALKTKYNVMSVPCLVINNEKLYFGKKNITQILDLIR